MATLKAAGDFVALVRLLQHDDTAVKTAAAVALRSLAYNNDDNQVLIAEAGAVAPLVELLRRGDAAGKTAAGALKKLAFNNDANVVAIEAVGGGDALL